MTAQAKHLEFAPPPDAGKGRALVAALFVHGLLLVALTAGIQWQQDDKLSAEAELWSAVPMAAAPPLAAVEPPPTSAPAPEPMPEPNPEPAPKPVEVKPPPPEVNREAEIALAKRRQQLDDEKKLREAKEAEKRKQIERQKEEDKKAELKKAQEKKDKLKAEEEKRKRDDERKEKERKDAKKQQEQKEAKQAAEDAKKLDAIRAIPTGVVVAVVVGDHACGDSGAGAPLIAEALRSLGVAPPMKVSPATGLETFAFAKTDAEFIELEEHESPDVHGSTFSGL